VRLAAGLPPSNDSIANSFLGWVLGLCGVYAALFGAGAFVYGDIAQGIASTGVFVVAAGWLILLGRSMWRNEDDTEPAADGSAA
jgi:hypothetical protein